MKQFFFTLLTVLSASSFSQNNWSVYDIRGDRVSLDCNKTYLAIGCDSRNCHDCIMALWYYCSQWSEEINSVETIVVIKGCGIGERRSAFSAIKEYVPEGIPIYFDLTPHRKEALMKKKYDLMPILIVLKPNERRRYFSYKDLFYNVQEDELMGSRTDRKIRELLMD